MGRIRTIKPEFPQSESIGKLSREARLFFILLWTFADDAGRARAASRMLASLLYPYDDDAGALIEGWLRELEQENHIRRYEVNGSHYLEVVKWLEHQKIDKPSMSRLPAFEEGSRALATIREASTTDLGPGPGPGPSTLDHSDKANALSDAGASVDHRTRLFNEGLQKLAAMTGKGPDACRSFVGKCLKAASDDAVTVLGLIEDAERNRVVNPSAWIVARLKSREGSNGRQTVHDAARDLSERLTELDKPAPSELCEPEGAGFVRLLPPGRSK